MLKAHGGRSQGQTSSLFDASVFTKPHSFTDEEAVLAGWTLRSSFRMTQTSELRCALFQLDSQYLVSLHNPTDSPFKLPAGTFLGQGGEGSFEDVSQETQENVPGVWMFNRLTEFKRDGKEKASGGIVIMDSESDLVDLAKVKIDLLEVALAKVNHNAEFTVYAHKVVRTSTTRITPSANPIAWIPQKPTEEHVFEKQRIGMWLKPLVKQCPDRVTPQSIPRFEGVVRSAFAMYFKAMQLEPISNNPLCIFLSKAISIPPKQYFTLC